MRRAVSLLTFMMMLFVTGSALAVNVTIRLQFKDVLQTGPFTEQPLVGWRVIVHVRSTGAIAQDLSGVAVPELTTGSDGRCPAIQIAPGDYALEVARPVVDPYPAGISWPTGIIGNIEDDGEPFMTVSNSTNYSYTLGLDCGCGTSNDPCDDCNNGACFPPNGPEDYQPTFPERCNDIDDDCDQQTDEGLPENCTAATATATVIGCADRTREGFMDYEAYPLIAACGGSFTAVGLDTARACPAEGGTPAGSGNHLPRPGRDCAAADLCALGWHVCRGPDDVALRAGAGCADAVDEWYASFGVAPFGVDVSGATIAPYPGGAFFVSRANMADGVCDEVVQTPTESDGIFGCGNLGAASSECGIFDRMAGELCGGLRDVETVDGDDPATDWGYQTSTNWAWSCGATLGGERAALVKILPDRQGGALCCKDSDITLPEVCDGVDNDADGATDENSLGLVPGNTCPIGERCGTVACRPDGSFDCINERACADTTCDGIDDDGDGQTDEEYQQTPTSCGIGACRAQGVLRCVGGDEDDSCVELDPSETSNNDLCDKRDGDCDGVTDEDFTSAPVSCGQGVCASTGIPTCAADGYHSNCTPLAPQSASDTTCDGVDEDCGGGTDEDFVGQLTTCGTGACTSTSTVVSTCVGGGVVPATCTPKTPIEGVIDDTCNGVDDDCDGETDEAFGTRPITCGFGGCQQTGTRTCVDGDTVDTCTPLDPPVGRDTTCDGVDDDCDGDTDEEYDAPETTCGVGACERTGSLACNGGVPTDDCVAAEPGPDDTSCNGVDDDCNGTDDEGFVDFDSACGVGECAGQTGHVTCVDGAPVDSCDPLAGASEELCNGLDDDCDGDSDEGFDGLGDACDGDDSDSCSNGVLECATNGASVVCDEEGEGFVETCNGVDEDCDGDTDDGLPDCVDSDDDDIPDDIDNCRLIANTDQDDEDEDGLGDACDLVVQSGGGDCAGGDAQLGLWIVAIAGLARGWRRRVR